MIYSDTEFPKCKKLIFYGVGGYTDDFVEKHCQINGRVPMPDYFCDDRLGGEGQSYFDRPLMKWEEIAARHSISELIVVVMALAGGNLAIPGRNARCWEAADVRIGRCLDMRFEIEKRKASGEFFAVRDMLADERSRQIFEVMTEGLAAGSIWFRNVYSPHPYFGNDVISTIRNEEVYIDAGANLGEDMLRLARMNPAYGRMVGFEPDIRVFDTLAKTFSESRVAVRCEGLADRKGKIKFDASGVCGRLCEGGKGNDVEIVCLDDCAIEGISLIKMDVEGSEAAALLGAVETIARGRPRLAISAYHKAVDLFELPRLICELRDDYKLLLRQHSVYAAGTVLYAV